MPALLMLPRFMAVCVDDDSVVPLVLTDQPCPEHSDASPVWEEVIEAATKVPTYGAVLCRVCMDEINWVLSEVTYSPVA